MNSLCKSHIILIKLDGTLIELTIVKSCSYYSCLKQSNKDRNVVFRISGTVEVNETGLKINLLQTGFRQTCLSKDLICSNYTWLVF
jgi:hypothetical protein